MTVAFWNRWFLWMLMVFSQLARSEEKAGPWRWDVEVRGDDVWLRCSHQQESGFTYRLGAGGAIAELRAEGRRLLSPSFQGEATDRIIQWTAWSETLRHKVEELPDFEHRFNVTQGGTFANRIAPTMRVRIDGKARQVDVYAVPQDQWKSQQQEAMQAKLSCLTRYKLRDDGALVIRRVLLVETATLQGVEQDFDQLYLEAWTPFDRSGTFDGLALAVDPHGAPTWWYAADKNVPRYPHLPVEKTSGYAVVFQIDQHATRTAVGLVFGKARLQSAGKGGHVLNLMTWKNGIGVLPALQLHQVARGSVIDVSLALLPRNRLDGAMAAQLDKLVSELPAPRIHAPGDTLPVTLQEIVAELRDHQQKPGMRSEHLAPLVERVR